MNLSKKISLLALLFLGCCAFLVSGAGAFDYNGQAWCCRGIGYCVNPEEPINICSSTSDRTFVDIINDAASTWNGAGTMFQLVYTGPTNERGCIPDAFTGDCISNLDGQNTVSMSASCAFPAGVLATAWWWYTISPGNDDDCCIFESDICFNRDVEWYVGDDPGTCSGSCYDLESVALHEFGHWTSLGHEDDEALLGYRPVMYFSFTFCEMRRVLTADEIAGLSYIYDASGVIVPSLRCDPVHSHPPYIGSPKVPVPDQCPTQDCASTGCPPGPPFCDSVRTDPCILICPASDIVWTATITDSCGNPICDMTNTWLDFSGCSAQPCPGEEPNWPLVFPDSCDPATGIHYFTVDAGALDCVDCAADLFVNGAFCRSIPARFLDFTGDLCVTGADWLNPPLPCMDYDCDGAPGTAADFAIYNAHMNHCCTPCPPGQGFCDSLIFDPCLVVCPASDIVWTATLTDSCGNPICDPSLSLWFGNCNAIPCPNDEPDWPFVFPDSCDAATGVHYFTVDAGYSDPVGICDCDIPIMLNGAICASVPARFLDQDGDLCVTQADWFNVAPCNDYNCDGIIDAFDLNFFSSHLGHCCPSCPTGQPFCDSVTTDPCLLVCPASDIVWTATIKDSCGNPICDPNAWLDFSLCEAQPCPFEEPDWPLVFPDSCDPATGVHYFTVDASFILGPVACPDCIVELYVDSALCREIPVKFLDINGDFCVTDLDWINGMPCNDYNCDGTIDANDFTIHSAHLGHCCPGSCPPGPPFCDSLVYDDCLAICPAGDEIWTATVKDSCGNPICAVATLWLDFSACPSIPCDPHHPNWPLVFPDSCDAATGVHYFSIYASALDCFDCDVSIFLNGAVCDTVKGRFFDIDASGCVLQNDFFGGQPCADYDCDLASSSFDSLLFMSHLTHCCTGPCPDTTCDSGIYVTAWDVVGTLDSWVGPEPSTPGADLIPLLGCGGGMLNFFDAPHTNQCFGHTFNGWDTTCCILDAVMCIKARATGSVPSTDWLVFAENGVQVYGISFNDLITIYSGGTDSVWSLGDTLTLCLNLGALPSGTGTISILANLLDGDFDVKVQDDTDIDYLEIRIDLCCDDCCVLRGDVNGDGAIDISDLTYLVDWMFNGGPAPPCPEQADINGDGSIDISDLTYLVDWMFNGGPAPPPC